MGLFAIVFYGGLEWRDDAHFERTVAKLLQSLLDLALASAQRKFAVACETTKLPVLKIRAELFVQNYFLLCLISVGYVEDDTKGDEQYEPYLFLEPLAVYAHLSSHLANLFERGLVNLQVLVLLLVLCHLFSAILSFADLLLGFCICSVSVGTVTPRLTSRSISLRRPNRSTSLETGE